MDELLNIFIDPLKIAGKSIVLVVTYTILFLILEAFVPQFKKWGDTLFIIVLVLTLGQTVMDAFSLMGDIVNIAADFFLSITPILMSIIVVLNAVFSFIAWSPIVIAIFEFLILLCQKVLIPGIVIALILDFCTRFIERNVFFKSFGSDSRNSHDINYGIAYC